MFYGREAWKGMGRRRFVVLLALAAAGWVTRPASADTVVYWQTDGSGNWSADSNWYPGGQVPNANTFQVDLDSTFLVNAPAVNITIDAPGATCEYLAFDQATGNIPGYTISGANPLTIEAGAYAPYGSNLGAIAVAAGNWPPTAFRRQFTSAPTAIRPGW